MDSRERVYRAVEFGTPDRLPLSYNLSPGFQNRHGGAAVADLRQRFPSDFAETGFVEFGGYTKQIDVPETDAWGIAWLRLTDDYMGEAVGHPLADWSALEGYRLPDPLAVGDWSRVGETLARDGGRRYALADGDTLFQRLFYLRGFENLMLDIHYEAPEFLALRDQVVDYMLRRLARWLEFPIDGVRFRDDWGTQTSLFIHPEKWRRLFKPAYARLIGAVRAAGAHCWFHSDGQIAAILPDLLELGVQVLNPQAEAIGLDELRRDFASRVCFQGEVDRQQVMPLAAPTEAAAYARQVAAALGTPRGGCIGHTFVGPDVPLANLEAIWGAFMDYEYTG
ncbi:MAG: uroporphyrinogen decarboxylase family protein [Chloroflexota bacterium]